MRAAWFGGICSWSALFQTVLNLLVQVYIDYMKSANLVADVKAATPGGLGAHAVILLAVSEKPFQQAVEYVRPRGSIVAIGMPGNAYLKSPIFDTVVKMINIRGSYVGNRRDFAETIDFFARGLIQSPVKSAPLKDLPQVFELMGMCLFLPERNDANEPPCRARQDCWSLRS